VEINLLFGYPVEATGENWVHDCLSETLRTIHNGLLAAEMLPIWPEIIPIKYRPLIQNRRGLRDRLRAYQEALERLNPNEQSHVLQALENQNQISLLLSCECNCPPINDLPEPIHEPVKELLHFAFMLLTDLGIRDRQYKLIYEKLPEKVCPFCGCEYFDAPGQPREDLDHYLPENKYPFAAANLRNLVPMGHKCNSHYKLAQDILFTEDMNRRKAFDPYNNRNIQVNLDRSEPFEGAGGELPLWEIDFVPNSEEVETWDDIFNIRERYKYSILDESFKRWLNDFRAWCRSVKIGPVSSEELRDLVQRYCQYLSDSGYGGYAFLKFAVFKMLFNCCEQDNQRVISLLIDLTKGLEKYEPS
jgi:hypothetical protein